MRWNERARNDFEELIIFNLFFLPGSMSLHSGTSLQPTTVHRQSRASNPAPAGPRGSQLLNTSSLAPLNALIRLL